MTTSPIELYQLLQGVEESAEKLSSKLTSIQGVLEDAEKKKQQNQSASVKKWVAKLKEWAFDSQDVLETFKTDALIWQRKQKVRLFRPPGSVSPSQISYKIKAAYAMKRLLSRLDYIEKEKADLHLDVIELSPGAGENYRRRITSPIVHESDIVGRESDKDNIINMLLSQEPDDDIGEGNLSVIPIVGMGGSGKTTLAQLIFNDARLKSDAHFNANLMFWVCVGGNNYDYSKILKDMIEYHAEMEIVGHLSLVQLETRALEILRGNRFLLFLDDVWNDSLHDWEKLENILKHGGQGSKVLVTTRLRSVAEAMGTKPPYQLRLLPEEECWSLFKKIVSPRGSLGSSSPIELESIGKQIVHKCKGLPLAVKAMGRLLRHQTNVEKWRQILRHDILEAEENNLTTGDLAILPALRLSYDHLPSEIKQCFDYCCLFPKGRVFRKMELITLWKAASVIKPRAGYELDDIGSNYFEELLSRLLFQLPNADNRSDCTMHDLIHDLAKLVAHPYYCQIMKNGDLLNIPHQVRHIALICKDSQQHIMDKLSEFEKLRTLICHVEYSRNIGPALDKLLCNCKYMRTLDLSSSMITELPESVGELKLLRYLDLSKTEIRRLPNSLCQLYNLQTLKLLSCPWLFELPKDFGNLADLEHLELDDMFWHKSPTLPSYIGKIKKLQNLHAFRLGCKQGEGIDELKDLLHLKGSLHISRLENAKKTGGAYLQDKGSLLKVIYEWSSRDGSPQDEAQDREMLEDLQPHSNIKEIGILHYQGDRLPSWLRGSFVPKLTTLSLKYCKNIRIISLGELPHLRELSFRGLVELEEWSQAKQLNLRRLKIDSCPKLKKVPPGFPNLDVLKIKKCDSLEAFPVTGVSEINIINCPKLQQLPSTYAPRKLDISDCPLLTALPPSDFAGCLQDLSIDKCDDGRLLRAIPATSSLYSLVISNIQNLSSLPKLPRLPGLKALYIHECYRLVSLSDNGEPYQGLNSLQLLSIRGCPKLETLPEYMLPPNSLTCLIIGFFESLKTLGPGDILKKLTSLKDLYIQHCPVLESLPEEGCPTSLQHLRIEGCPLLMSRCHESGPDWPKIMDIPDLEIVEIPDQIPSDENSRTWYHHLMCCVNDLCRGIFRSPF